MGPNRDRCYSQPPASDNASGWGVKQHKAQIVLLDFDSIDCGIIGYRNELNHDVAR